jgi:cellulose synthase/poly-beta-1,6-N-acetylglucosamine synthase-like glycosyltransferase
LAEIRAIISPRYNPPPTPIRSRLIHGSVLLLWILLFARAFGGGGLATWSAGLAYIAYDTVLLVFVFIETLKLVRRPKPAPTRSAPLPTTIIVAAHNEERGLPATIAALFAQTTPAHTIIIADDGSTDGTAALLTSRYGLEAPPLGTLSQPSATHPTLRWLRLPRGGKANALNAALPAAPTELVLTVDADTLLRPDALAEMRHAFETDPTLVTATGVLAPLCHPTLSGRILQWFQTYEYVRNFLSRFAWMQQGGLLLISGAFGCYRRTPVLEVGGFDPDCLVEDYELTHRLRDYAGRHGLAWTTAVIGRSQATTDAPASLPAFLRQRRRWFGGFLQTQVWYRHMVGNPAYQRLGTMMLPVKAIDTLQPLYGLTGAVLLIADLVTGHTDPIGPIFGVIAAKIVLDLSFYLWSLHLYRRWLGRPTGLHPIPAILAALIEPFTFQLLRHTGAALGWVSFLRGHRTWGTREQAPQSTP